MIHLTNNSIELMKFGSKKIFDLIKKILIYQNMIHIDLFNIINI